MRILYTIILCLFCALSVLAQEKYEIGEQDYANQQIEMADSFRADGKIWVVVAIVGLVLGGLLVYAVLIDRKVSRLERLTEPTKKESHKRVAG